MGRPRSLPQAGNFADPVEAFPRETGGDAAGHPGAAKPFQTPGIPTETPTIMKSEVGMMPYFKLAGPRAWQETRSLLLGAPVNGIPAGCYGLIEFYCHDRTCNCRRVIFQVWAKHLPGRILATMNFGWESPEFYTRWMHGDQEAGREISGLTLEHLGEQSSIAQPLLHLVQSTALEDPDYVLRLRRHYRHVSRIIGRKSR